MLVPHWLGSARLCDRILVLKLVLKSVPRYGAVVEDGTHEEILKKGGEYARMWAAQAQWYAGQ